jgi:AcrR family transcriptional regulator
MQTAEARPLDAALGVMPEHGWDGLNLERVAAQAGLSRVTLWRQGVTKERLVDGLLARLTDDYRATLWPIMTASGPGAERLRAALEGLCAVADRHLELLLASDVAFHEAQRRADPRPSFVEPLVRLLHDGVADGTLQSPETSPGDAANVLFNTVCWSYVHLRGRHGWPVDKTRALVLGLVFDGVASRP